ncbi:MAG: UDP-3-O-(3-hydroxymyristoyl)glucosamine N-acyltransferase [Deltaproteobacteria bacterium]|nr:UDP-3-O-(3-hydroxymyristoyl)glucosamine N-acyltransferase [Deltaproteobacteria bacterium]
MEKTLKELAELVEGEVSGNGELLIKGVAPLESAAEGYIAFITSPKYAESLKTTSASAVIVPLDMKVEGKDLILSKNPQLAFAKLLTLYTSKTYISKGIDRRAFIGRNPLIGKDVTVYPFAYIGDHVEVGDRTVIHPRAHIGNGCTLGEDVVIYPNATIMDGCIIGNRVIIHAGAVIGSDGFGYARDWKKHYKIPQVGIVRIDDDVEIGANTTIDRASFGRTWIKSGTKIDNLVQVAHNVVIGEDSIIVAQVGIAGSSKIGNNVILAGQAAISDHVTIGDNVTVGGQSGVISDIPDNQVMSGYPTIPHREWLKASLTFPHLPEMRKSINELKKKVAELEAKLKS